jgi:hypothetical protein
MSEETTVNTVDVPSIDKFTQDKVTTAGASLLRSRLSLVSDITAIAQHRRTLSGSAARSYSTLVRKSNARPPSQGSGFSAGYFPKQRVYRQQDSILKEDAGNFEQINLLEGRLITTDGAIV